MKIASWNVNSLRVRLPQVLQWMDAMQPDVLALQETKLVDEKFPQAEIEAAGYHCVFNGQPTYNGVALISKTPLTIDAMAIPDLEDPQRRVIGALVKDTYVLNLYVPNGQTVESDKYQYKLGWLEKLHAWLPELHAQHKKLIITGDFNIAPDDRDVYEPDRWRGKVLFSEPEHTALKKLLDTGLQDTFRLLEQPENIYSWWDFRTRGFSRNHGLRIDLILASEALSKTCTGSHVDYEPRGWERPSDHAPVWAEFTS